jgi:hypothetical protein
MQTTKSEQRHIARQPFDIERLVEFCGTKKLAKQLAVDLGDALDEADRARRNGECGDTMFESMFWNGVLFIGSDELYDMNVSTKTLVDYCSATAYDSELDATFHLCSYGRRRFIAVQFEFKGYQYAVSAWWLTREDNHQPTKGKSFNEDA